MTTELLEKTKENLFNFSVDQNDLKSILGAFPKDEKVNMVTLEYEVQILKIVTVGWSINYFMEKNKDKDQLGEMYWKTVYEFSKNLSDYSSGTTGKDIDYYNILNERLNLYIEALNNLQAVSEPSKIVGHVFGEICGYKDNIDVIGIGTKVFSATILAVQAYLSSLEMI